MFKVYPELTADMKLILYSLHDELEYGNSQTVSIEKSHSDNAAVRII